MKEIFKPIPGYEKYFVSNTGKVKYVKNGNMSGKERILAIDKEKATVRITVNKKSKSYTVARLVAESFLDEESDGRKRVTHKDGNIFNNNVSNLKWDGLKRSDIKVIREKIEEGSTFAELARTFDTNSSHIRRIVERKVWKEV